MRRMIIIGLGTRVEAVKSSILRYPIEQRIHHGVEVVKVYAFEIEILAKNSQFVRVFTLGKEIQIQPTAFSGYLYVVTFSAAHLPVQVWRVL